MEYKMKITKRQLKSVIREVIEESVKQPLIDGKGWGMFSPEWNEDISQEEYDKANEAISEGINDDYNSLKTEVTKDEFFEFAQRNFRNYGHLGANDTEGREALWTAIEGLDFKE